MLIVIVIASLLVALACSAVFALVPSLSAVRDVWFAPGFFLSRFYEERFPPQSESAEGLVAALGLALATVVWFVVLCSVALLAYRSSRASSAG